MKVAEVSGGVSSTLRIRSTSGKFDLVPQRKTEVTLVRSAGETLLKYQDHVWSVEGVSSVENTRLTDVLDGLPILVFVAQGSLSALVLETRRFSQELRITETMEIGLDDKVMKDVRRGHKVGGTASDVAVWLENRLFLEPVLGEGEFRRMVISGDVKGRVDAFRIHGFKIAADVRRIDDKLRIERVVRGGSRNSSRLMLLSAPVKILDATIAAELNGTVRTILSQAVAGTHSYMRTWQEYHKLERQNVLQRARLFGALEYQNCERRRDGNWRFNLKPIEDFSERLGSLGQWSHFELEAGKHEPLLGKSDLSAKKSNRKEKCLSASVVDVDGRGYFIDLSGPDEDEDQPKPPSSGYLYLSTGGDEVRLRRRERAEEALRTGNCPLPQLGLLMEGRPAPAARRVRVSVDGPKLKAVIREIFGKSKPTLRQLKAIEISINTPDICLIQGPPGTGKTKVITAIERCLAVLADEGSEPSHRILVCAAQHDAVENVAQRTEVFGLPAVKVGRRRRGSDSEIDPAQSFADELIEKFQAMSREQPEAERLSKARNIVLACVSMRSLPSEQAGRIRDLIGVLGNLLPPTLQDRADELAIGLERPVGLGNPEEAEKLMKAARGIRVDDAAFSDDGPIKARVALNRLDSILTTEESEFLKWCADVELEIVPPWLSEGRRLRDALIDRLTQPVSTPKPRLDEGSQKLLLEILDTVNRRLATSREGYKGVVAAYLHELETNLGEVERALEHYTVVLASTLQQAASNKMRQLRGIEEGQTTFESVIVDEAARANPLDLFIPLSMAQRRVVLVGDHRQLPHLLEPEVERQLSEGVEEGSVEKQTLEAVQASLFERMWGLLRSLEEEDRIQRTVTLNAQYRMHPILGDYVSREFYEVHDDGKIESPRPASEFSHDLPGYSLNGVPCVAAWLNVPHKRGSEMRGVSKHRPVEARAIAKEIHRLIDYNSKLTFAVISFYRAQVDEIGQAMIDVGLTERTKSNRGWKIAENWASTYNTEGKKVERLRIGTVDAFQGKEFDVVFLSLTRSNKFLGRTNKEKRRKFGHLMLENRLCVAMSRQQRLLVVVGDLAFVQAEDAQKPLRSLYSFTNLCGGEYGIIR